jgi:chromosomal replication initiator protein
MPGLKEKVINLKRIVSLDAITKAITMYYDIDIANIRTRGRNKTVVQARYIMCYLLRKHTGMSLDDIAQYLSPAITDHTTVMHGVEFIKGQLSLKHDNPVKKILNEIYI